MFGHGEIVTPTENKRKADFCQELGIRQILLEEGFYYEE